MEEQAQPAGFHLSDVLSIIHDRAVSYLECPPILPNGSSLPERELPLHAMVQIIEYITGKEIRRLGTKYDSMELVEGLLKAQELLSEAYPRLALAQYPENLKTPETIRAWVKSQAAEYGEWLPVYTAEQYLDPSIDTNGKPLSAAPQSPSNIVNSPEHSALYHDKNQKNLG